MHRRIYIVIVGLLALIGGANAQTLSVGTIEGKVGEQATLTVSLTDAASATALQFNLSLPANVTVNESGCALGNAAKNHTLSVNAQGGQVPCVFTRCEHRVTGTSCSGDFVFR